MYCKKHNILFIHIPKTGGQSIAAHFLGLEGLTWADRWAFGLTSNKNERFGPPQVAHFTADEYRNLPNLCGSTVDDAIKFAVVRNPWDRLWSEYHFFWNKHCSWDDFFNIFPHGMIDNYETGDDHLRHIKPQCEFITPDVEILRFETLNADFEAFCEKHSIPNEAGLPFINVSDSGSYLKAYDLDKIEIVRQFYKSDIEAFDYEFGE